MNRYNIYIYIYIYVPFHHNLSLLQFIIPIIIHFVQVSAPPYTPHTTYLIPPQPLQLYTFLSSSLFKLLRCRSNNLRHNIHFPYTSTIYIDISLSIPLDHCPPYTVYPYLLYVVYIFTYISIFHFTVTYR